jgi:hypothetical protein
METPWQKMRILVDRFIYQGLRRAPKPTRRPRSAGLRHHSKIRMKKAQCSPTQPATATGTNQLSRSPLVNSYEQITSAWVWWYNTSRLMHRLGRRPPAEAEAEYYDRHRAGHPDQAHT